MFIYNSHEFIAFSEFCVTDDISAAFGNVNHGIAKTLVFINISLALQFVSQIDQRLA
jgi:hypothetical protein